MTKKVSNIEENGTIESPKDEGEAKEDAANVISPAPSEELSPSKRPVNNEEARSARN